MRSRTFCFLLRSFTPWHLQQILYI
uniref:Uncharacterized protein n=1 Tax=Rhizophora mucronata TaxID=61149 RepID=A0A2P2QJF2_RHIMU